MKTIKTHKLQLKLSLVWALLWLISGCQPGNPDLAGTSELTGQQTVPENSDRLPLWRIDMPNNSIWLLGSIHLLNENYYPLPQAIDTAYAQADIIWFETDLDRLQSPKMSQKMFAKAEYQGSRQLSDDIDQRTFQNLLIHTKRLGYTKSQAQSMLPWYWALNIALETWTQHGFSGEYGIDQHYWHRAGNDKKTRMQLEAAERHIALFTDLSIPDQVLALKQTLRDVEHADSVIPALLNAWKSGDIEAMNKLTDEGFADQPTMRKHWLDDRNHAWVEKLLPHFKRDQNMLIIVGFAHMAGQNGLPALLLEEGYQAKQVMLRQ